jgi:hypothetical protein
VRRIALVLSVVALAPGCMPPSWGANALLHPSRRAVGAAPALPHRDFAVDAGGVTLRGWLFPAQTKARAGTVVYLHGVADNRASGVWIAERLVRAGLDVVAYDSRAHGDSTGEACTYGFHEKRDLSRVLDRLGVERAIAVGVSLGAAVALQAAAEDPRITAVVSVSTFSSLHEIARDRVGRIASERQLAEAIAIAERTARFEVAEVSPVAAAARLRIPVLVVHGAQDAETRPEHSKRVYAALAGPKRLVLVDGAGHDDALARAWPEVEAWIVLTGRAGAR